MVRKGILLALFVIVSFVYVPLRAQEVTIKVNEPTVELSPYLYGLFFEDINFAADGGLYAELIQNRSFEYFPVLGKLNPKGHLLNPMTAWETIIEDGAQGHVYVTRSHPLNGTNRNSLEIITTNKEGYIGVANTGYDGIPLVGGESYNFSFYVRREEVRNADLNDYNIIVQLVDEQGSVLDSKAWPSDRVNSVWTKYEHVFVPSKSVSNGRLVVLAVGKGLVQLDMVSLMPENTFKNRDNGLRADMVDVLKELNPKFLRFPGGCILHGSGLDNVYRWKETVGDVAERKPNWNRWGYHQTYGLGFYEYFLLCEDLGMTPLPVVPLGVSCSFSAYECVPMEHLDETIQDALDLVEFATGSVNTKWGKVRAEMGHPEPFELKYICLGNEEGDFPEVYERVPKFVEAFKRAYPSLKLIGNSGLGPDVPLYDKMDELGVWSSDEHYYKLPEWYIKNQTRFDDADRTKTKVFVGEYASRGNTMYNAVSEAIYLTGVERNADVVEMTCYAPLFAHYEHTQWKQANLIWFNNEKIVKTPNYYVQQFFGANKGDVYLKNTTQEWPGQELAVSTTLDKASNEVIVKIANAFDKSHQLTIAMDGVKKLGSKASITLLKGGKSAKNTLENPDNVKPEVRTQKTGDKMVVDVPAFSVQVVRIKVVK